VNSYKENWKNLFEALGVAIVKLRDILDQVGNHPKEIKIYRDATIRRFEITVDLFLKTLKKCFAYEYIEANSPREVLQEAYKAKLYLPLFEEDYKRLQHKYQLTSAAEETLYLLKEWVSPLTRG
jgi:nucleotidyltransferase substrate binding protein (TIGR01987 family)